jgi:hypothetical protein
MAVTRVPAGARGQVYRDRRGTEHGAAAVPQIPVAVIARCEGSAGRLLSGRRGSGPGQAQRGSRNGQQSRPGGARPAYPGMTAHSSR